MLERTSQFFSARSDDQGTEPSPRGILRRITDRLRSFGWLFLLTVIVPTSLAILYFGLIASDVYVSESRFVVRSPDKPSTGGFGMLLKSAGFANAGDEIYAAKDYVTSRDALRSINRDGAFREAYTRPSISFFNRFDPLGLSYSFEELYQYYTGKVRIDYDTTSAITTLTVRAYRGQDAARFNEQLLEMAEATVNRMSTRGRQDLIRFATSEVDAAKEKARQAGATLARYRNSQGVVDPEKQAQMQLQMVSKLQDELIAARNQMSALRSITPDNPQIPVLATRIGALEQDITAEMSKVAGGSRSLAGSAAAYQRLRLESEFADKQLAAAMASLEDAQNEARRKQAYVERIVQPNLPDEAEEPRRMRGIVATLALGLVAWGILSMLLAGIREHGD